MQPIAILTQGLSGSGKSYYLNLLIKNQQDFILIDSDQWIQSHPDYDPKNPQELYPWAKAQANAAHKSALENRQSFILDGTMSEAHQVSRIHEARAAGFRVLVLTVDVSLEIALHQNAMRERNVPEEVVRGKALTMQDAIQAVREHADGGWIITRDSLDSDARISRWEHSGANPKA